MDEYEVAPALVWGIVAFGILLVIICGTLLAVPLLTGARVH
jgi:hypothetical protein